MVSTHRISYEPLGGAAESAKRCLDAIRTAKSHNMVRDASHLIPLDVVDKIEELVSEEYDELFAQARCAKTLREEANKERHSPSVTPELAALASTLMALPRHGIENKLSKTDFTNGSVGGPFPGSVSAYGKHQSETYWQHVKDAAAGRLKVTLPGRLTANGTRLKNWNCESPTFFYTGYTSFFSLVFFFYHTTFAGMA